MMDFLALGSSNFTASFGFRSSSFDCHVIYSPCYQCFFNIVYFDAVLKTSLEMINSTRKEERKEIEYKQWDEKRREIYRKRNLVVKGDVRKMSVRIMGFMA